ncbi:helix-turn-helix domain-containing protein [Senegalia massiliensis]|uniref:MerR family transcriptional regulator n=1 Tax=Senegalia massiliensis TaxID=1720316 RepID=A0A845QYR4_9CLOT|nr:helix-turn-helix domain-containing protein [Senegalia massiliensis]NBI07625.1 MerR family transcriptional regulator [Senegalia massiliensis]
MKGYSITEVAAKLDGLHVQTIRKWEKDFELIIPRNDLGHRQYTEKEIEVLRNIKNMKDEGAGIEIIKKILSKSENAAEQKENALELVSIDRLNGKELNEIMINKLSQYMEERDDKLINEFANTMKTQLSEIIDEKETLLKKDYQKKLNIMQKNIEETISNEIEETLSNELEKQEKKIREQLSSENSKLMKYIENRDKEKEKKPFFKRLFK